MAPPIKLCTDNGAMIAWAGIERLRRGMVDALDFAARRTIAFDMEKLAVERGTVISAAMLGALAGSGALPFERSAYEAIVRQGARGANASLAAFADAFDRAREGKNEAPNSGPQKRLDDLPADAGHPDLNRLVGRLRAELPELPDAKKARFMSALGLSAYDSGVLAAEQANAAFFEAVAAGRDAKTAANWVMGELFGALHRLGIGVDASPVSAHQLGALLDLIRDGTISGRIAKEVFAEMIETGADAVAIVEAKGLRQVSDTSAIEAAVDAALAANPGQVAQYATNPKVLGFFVGQIMKATGGKANPALVNELLRKKLED